MLPGRDGTLTYQALTVWSIQVHCHPSFFNQEPFSPVLCVGECVCGGWDVEWRFLAPVALYVISAETDTYVAAETYSIKAGDVPEFVFSPQSSSAQ